MGHNFKTTVKTRGNGNEKNYLLLVEAVIDVTRKDYLEAYRYLYKRRGGRNREEVKRCEYIIKSTEDWLKHGWIGNIVDINPDEVLRVWRGMLDE